MNLSDLIRERYSVRAYKDERVPTDVLNDVLEAARLAPTAANRQPFRIILMDIDPNRMRLGSVYQAPWFFQAPLAICMCAVPDEAWTNRDGQNYAWVDATIAMDHLILAAADAGLGTCWIAAFDVDAAREAFEIPPEWQPVALTPLGYPNDSPRQKKRKSLDELVVRR